MGTWASRVVYHLSWEMKYVEDLHSSHVGDIKDDKNCSSSRKAVILHTFGA